MTQPNPTPKPRPRICAYADCEKTGEITVYHPEYHGKQNAPISRAAFCSALHLVLWELDQMIKTTPPGPFRYELSTAAGALVGLDIEMRREAAL